MKTLFKILIFISLFYKSITPLKIGYHQLFFFDSLRSIYLLTLLLIILKLFLIKDLSSIILSLTFSILSLLFFEPAEAINVFLMAIFISFILKINILNDINFIYFFSLISQLTLIISLFSLLDIGALISLEIPQLNYIASVFFIIYIVQPRTKMGWLIKAISIFCLLIIRSRTSILSIFIFELILNWKNLFKYIIFAIPPLIIYNLNFYLDLFFNKWKNSNGFGVGRFDVWNWYITDFIENPFLYSIPLVLRKQLGWDNNIFKDLSRHYDAHNIFLQLNHDLGYILLFLLIVIGVFNIRRSKYLIPILCFGFFEPSLYFTNNLISILAFSLILKKHKPSLNFFHTYELKKLYSFNNNY